MKEIKIFGILLFASFFIKCASVNKTAPFNIQKATYKESLTEIEFTIPFSSENPVEFLKLFFRNQTTKVTYKSANILSATFSKTKKINFQLHGDSKKEFGNKPPPKKVDLPFKLNENEVMLSYKEKNEIKFFKLSNLKKEN